MHACGGGGGPQVCVRAGVWRNNEQETRSSGVLLMQPVLQLLLHDLPGQWPRQPPPPVKSIHACGGDILPTHWSRMQHLSCITAHTTRCIVPMAHDPAPGRGDDSLVVDGAGGPCDRYTPAMTLGGHHGTVLAMLILGQNVTFG